MCQVGEMEATLKVIINPLNDPPKVNPETDGDAVFPPVPSDMSNFQEKGVSVGMITKTNPKLIGDLSAAGLGEKVLKLMANGKDPQTLLSRPLSKKVKPLITDEKSNVGIAVIYVQMPPFGKWRYKIEGKSWEDVSVKNSQHDVDGGKSLEFLFLTPKDRLKFQPTSGSVLWSKSEAFNSSLGFLGWDGSDNGTAGKRVLNVSDVTDFVSSQAVYMTVNKLGCNKKPGSMAKNDSCGKCNGRNACVGCDGQANSDAFYGEFLVLSRISRSPS